MNLLGTPSGSRAGFHLSTIGLWVPICLLVAACGGSGGGKSVAEPKINTDYSGLTQPQLKSDSLRAASATELDNLLKNGLRLTLASNKSYGEMMVTALDKTAAMTGFSRTNVQVAGVDEADVVKYDGKHIFLVTPAESTDSGLKSRLKILSTQPANASSQAVSDTLIDASQWGSPSELYLVEQAGETTDLLTIRHSQMLMSLLADSAKFAADPMIYPMNQGVELSLYDVRTPATPSVRWSFSFDGDLLGTRKIGNRLYIISRFVPSLSTLAYGADTEEKREANEKLIRSTQVEKLLPEYRINGGSPQPLGSAANCLISSGTKASDGHLGITNITVIDLASQQLIESQCLDAPVEGIYVSASNVYLGASYYLNNGIERAGEDKPYTMVHKFALTNSGVDYVATGSVDGTLGWSNSSYFMDEYQGDLRLVTTDTTNWQDPKHRLSILRPVNGSTQMRLVSRLPNDANPKAIGKPGEQIFAVRFHGPTAYVVTFLRKDPLYVLDLSKPEAPVISGELNIPGFSTYLQPVGDHLLFSLGHEVDDSGTVTGVKVALFDVSDRSNPKELNKYVYGSSGSSSFALQDFHALSWQQEGDKLRIALPIDFVKTIVSTDGLFRSEWDKTSLRLFEIDGIDGANPVLSPLGEIIGKENTDGGWQQWNYTQRSVLHDDAAYFIYGEKVIGAPWPEVATQ